ncbi:hypothetical protein JHB91_08225 [Luteimonas sp. MC1828]|nr:hypothetical protein [Luteimonas sp. MC1828]
MRPDFLTMPTPVSSAYASRAPGGWALLPWAVVPALLAIVAPSGRRTGLAIGVAIGLVFGIDQQLRGAHFLSHDLWSLALCWAVAVTVAALWPTPAERVA